jgi:uncharacterized OsmC-like protein
MPHRILHHAAQIRESSMNDEPIEVLFPGGKSVSAKVGGFLVHTDQSPRAGGAGSAPEPFDLFLASIATCAGIFALNFCQSRDIPSEGLQLHMNCIRDPATRLISRMELALTLPQGFPEKYRGGIVKAVELCTVKRHIMQAPEFAVALRD